jgi:predicted RNase H-like HicB family nuclease
VNTYFAIVEKDPGSAYGVSFPDLPGCYAAADAEGDIYEAAQTALALFAQDQEEMPKPRSLVALQRDTAVKRDIAGGAFLIGVPIVQIERKARYNVMLDRALVREVDRAARVSGVSRSEFMANALGSFLTDKTGAVVIDRSKTKKRPLRRGKAA